MTATAAPTLAVLCSCGHAARMHDSDGCLRNLCGCSRNRADAAATTQVKTAQGETLPAPAMQPVQKPVQPPADARTTTPSAPASCASSEADAEPNPTDDQTEPPTSAVQQPAPPAKPVQWADLADAVTNGRGHDDPRIKALAVRIDGELQALADLLANDIAKAELRARRDQLKAELAEIEAELGGTEHVCDQPGCGRSFGTLQALGAHRYRGHGIRRGDPA